MLLALTILPSNPRLKYSKAIKLCLELKGKDHDTSKHNRIKDCSLSVKEYRTTCSFAQTCSKAEVWFEFSLHETQMHRTEGLHL